MGQYWMIGNIDQQCHLEPLGGVHISSIMASRSLLGLIQLLNIPEFLSATPARPDDLEYCATFIGHHDSFLMRLPQEVLDQIIEECTADASDLLCLSLTCRSMFCMTEKSLRRVFERSATWAGDRLICVGDYASGYPGSVAEEEINEWIDNKEIKEYFDREWDKPLYQILKAHEVPVKAPMPPLHSVEENRMQWRKIEETFKNTGERPPEPWAQNRKAWSSHYTVLQTRHKYKRGASQLDKLEERSREMGFGAELDLFPETFRFPIAVRIGAEALGRVVRMLAPKQSSTLFLRNLSKKEYVKWEKSEEGGSLIRLGQALCYQIRWSQGTSNETWAGDRFDVRGSVSFIQKRDGWFDVTESVFRSLDVSGFVRD